MHKLGVKRHECGPPERAEALSPEQAGGSGADAVPPGRDNPDWAAEKERRYRRAGLREFARSRHKSGLAEQLSVENSARDRQASQINSLYAAQEEVAKRIAQRLHDDAAQMLAVVYLELAKIARACPRDTAGKIEGVVTLLDEVCDQIRGLSHEPRPPMLEYSGLVPALRALADSVEQRSGLKIVVRGGPFSLPATIEMALYRVVQEAFSNVVRHAHATRIEVKLSLESQRVHCVVSDDGVGMANPEASFQWSNGLGLVGIYERVAALRGDCRIVSGVHGGVTLDVEIPL